MAVPRSENVHLHDLHVDRGARERLLGQQPALLWFTGLSGSGKSTVANLVESELHARGFLTYMLDGDNVRHGLCGDLGFSDTDRTENIRRVTEVARLMVDAGVIVVASFISPFAVDREQVRAGFAPGEFFEIYADVPLEVAEARDPKGLYAKARRGEITNYTGIDSPYETPASPELRLDMVGESAEANTAHVLALLERSGRLRRGAGTPGASG